MINNNIQLQHNHINRMSYNITPISWKKNSLIMGDTTKD